MKRLLAKILIDWCEDLDRLPQWIRDSADRDIQGYLYQREDLESRLSTEAKLSSDTNLSNTESHALDSSDEEAWHQAEQVSFGRTFGADKSSIRSVQWALTIAAMFFIAAFVAGYSYYRSENISQGPARPVLSPSRESETDLRPLLAMITASNEIARKIDGATREYAEGIVDIPETLQLEKALRTAEDLLGAWSARMENTQSDQDSAEIPSDSRVELQGN